jgi:hypothetical protein
MTEMKTKTLEIDDQFKIYWVNGAGYDLFVVDADENMVPSFRALGSYEVCADGSYVDSPRE